MKYIALIYSDESKNPAYDSPEFGALMAAYQKANETFVKDGVLRGGDALNDVATATTVRVRNGRTETMDGPFAETKEQLGGYYIFECANLDEAIRYAALIPNAANGCVELRPLMEFDVGA